MVSKNELLEMDHHKSYHVKALQDKAADVATLIFYNFEVIEAQQMGLKPGFFSLKEWGVPDFCQLVLFTTPQRMQALRPQLRKLVLAMRRATGLIKREPQAWELKAPHPTHDTLTTNKKCKSMKGLRPTKT